MNRVKFNLKNKKVDESLIFLIYRYDKKRLKISTGIKVKVKHWNELKQSIREVAGFYEYPSFNAELKRFEEAIHKAHSFYRTKGETPSLIQLKEKTFDFKSNSSSSVSEKPKTVVSFIKNHIEKSETLGIKRGTLQGFEQLQKVIEKMPDGRTLEFKDLSKERLMSMVKLMVDKFDYRTSQIDKVQRKLVTIVNLAKENSIYDINPSFLKRNKPWRVKLTSADDSGKGIAFTPEELKKIEKLKLNDRLGRVRDRFLIGVNVGQRFETFIKLCADNIIEKSGKPYWDFIQNKTKVKLQIPVNEKCIEILNKYEGYPPTISKVNFNKYLKEVCELAEINDIQILRKNQPNKKIKEDRVPKFSIVSSHDCRRTLATILHDNKVPLMNIKAITGHSKIKYLEIYLKIDRNNPISHDLELY